MSRRPPAAPLEATLLRLMVALAHSIDDVTLELYRRDGDTVVVAHRRLDAHLDPCQLRRLVLHELGCGSSRLLGTIVDARIVAGLDDIGAGLHRRRAGGEERWFATSLSSDEVCALFAACTLHVPEGAMNVSARPDDDLGVTVVGITANHPAFDADLDVVATWALSAAVAQELIQAARNVDVPDAHRRAHGSPGHWRDGV